MKRELLSFHRSPVIHHLDWSQPSRWIITDRGQMWRFFSSGSSGNHPYLHSLNDNQGRQTWEWDEAAGACCLHSLICNFFVKGQCSAHQAHIRASAPQLTS